MCLAHYITIYVQQFRNLKYSWGLSRGEKTEMEAASKYTGPLYI